MSDPINALLLPFLSEIASKRSSSGDYRLDILLV
jgi:hypothetical protein